MQLLQHKAILGAATVGGALIGLALEKYSQGSANVGHRYAKAGVLGAVTGGSMATALVLSKQAAELSGKANWGLIGGSAGFSATLLYHLVSKNYTMKTLIRNTAVVSVAAGAAGYAVTKYQQTR